MLATQTVTPAGFGVPPGVLTQWTGGMSYPEPLHTGPSPPLTTHEIAARCRNCVFFAKVPPSVLEPELERLFSRCGTVVGINLYRPWALAKTSKGCGIVEYTTPAAAAVAVRQLDGLRHWARAPYPLVVEPLDSRRPVVLPSVLQSRQHVLCRYGSSLTAAGSPQQGCYGSGLVTQQQQLPMYNQQQQVLVQAPQQQQQGGLVYTYLPSAGTDGNGGYAVQSYAGAPMMALQQPAPPQASPQQQLAAGSAGTYYYMPAAAAVGAAPASAPLWAAAGGSGSQGGVAMQVQGLAQSLNNMQLQGVQQQVQQPTYMAQGAGMSPVFSAAAQVSSMQLSPHSVNGGVMAVPASPPPASQPAALQQWGVPGAAMMAVSSAPAATHGFTAAMVAAAAASQQGSLGSDGVMMQANWVGAQEVHHGAAMAPAAASMPMSSALLAASSAAGHGGSYLAAGGLTDAAASHMVHMTHMFAASAALPPAAMVAPVNV